MNKAVNRDEFQGQRLQAARLGREMSAVALGQLIGRPSNIVSAWESGQMAPSGEMVAKLSSVLSHPLHYFHSKAPVERPDKFFARSLSAAGRPARMRVIERLCFLQEMGYWLQEILEFPELDLPPGYGGANHRVLSDQDVEAMAAACRAQWAMGQGPVANMILALENAGIVVGMEEFSSASLDSVSAWSPGDGRPYVLLSGDSGSAARSRYDAAYELGHILLHHGVDAKQSESPNGHLEMNRQAALFAAAFLLPAERFMPQVSSYTLSNFMSLKELWGVTVDLMIRRCESLGLVTGGVRYNLWKQYNAKGWNEGEPLESGIPTEEPRLLSRSFRLIKEEDICSVDDILAGLPFAASDIEALSGLPPGYLSGPKAEVIVMPRVRRAKRRATPGSSTVVPFPGPGLGPRPGKGPRSR